MSRLLILGHHWALSIITHEAWLVPDGGNCLLKDLDKSNGWFNGKGGVRMFLFYLNRYLRLSIPYALAIGVYVGVIPLLLAGGPIASSNLAFVEVGR